MKIEERCRKFAPTKEIELCDCGSIRLENDEQVTFETENGPVHDVTRKSWGFYISNSLNRTQIRRGYKAALVLSNYEPENVTVFINLVDVNKMDEYKKYLKENKAMVLSWLDEWLAEEVKR